MKKLLGAVIVFLFSFVIFGGSNQVYALDSCTDADMFGSDFSVRNFQPSYGATFIEGEPGTVSAIITNLGPNQQYTIECQRDRLIGWGTRGSYSMSSDADGFANLAMSTNQCWAEEGSYRLRLETSTGVWCEAATYQVFPNDEIYCSYKSVTDSDGNSECFEEGELINFEFEIVNGDGTAYQGLVGMRSNTVGGGLMGDESNQFTTNSDGRFSGQKVVAYASSTMWFNVYEDANPSKQIDSCTVIGPIVSPDKCLNKEAEFPDELVVEEFSLCDQIPLEQQDERAACYECIEGSEDDEANQGVWTAIGCIKRDPVSIMQRLITVGLGISGGVALITFLAAGFIFSTSQGDPKATGQAKEMMTASVIGIIFVIFSVTLLQFIGFSILRIPGFGG